MKPTFRALILFALLLATPVAAPATCTGGVSNWVQHTFQLGACSNHEYSNHNGVSEAGELDALPSLNISALHLDYKESKRTDEHGNRFRYRAKVGDAKGAKAGRWAWDVFLVKAP